MPKRLKMMATIAAKVVPLVDGGSTESVVLLVILYVSKYIMDTFAEGSGQNILESGGM